MRVNLLMLLATTGLACGCLASVAEAEGRANLGIVLWRDETNLKVERATDFDGANITGRERARDWDIHGSGVGARFGYEFPRLVTLHAEIGTAEATVRDREIADPRRRVDSRGLVNGIHFALGARLDGGFSDTGNGFWSLGGTVRVTSIGLDEDVNTSWDYDETRFALDGALGTWIRGEVGAYAGLRLVHANADLRETDRTNPPGQQQRTVELTRDGAVDVLIGARTRSARLSTFTEIALVGTFSATAGVSLRF